MVKEGRTSSNVVVTLVAVGVLAVSAIAARSDADPSAPRADPTDVYSPVAAGEPLPAGFFQLLPRDLIPPIYDPAFVAGKDSGWPDDADVIGIEINGEAKAYPVSVLNGHEMVVDRVGGEPILVTWCPVCSTATVHRRVIAGNEAMFGVQGALYMNAQTWWDHGTGSIWSQPLGEAIAGPLTGTSVEMLPSSFTTWGAWHAAHPHSLALDAPAAATGFDLTDLLIVVDFESEVRAYRTSDIRREGVISDVVAGVELAVVGDPAEPERWAVYSRRVDGVLIDLEVDHGVLRDRISGSTFGFQRGLGIDGPFGDRHLAQLPAMVAKTGGGPMRFPVFHSFWPDGTTWRPD